MNEKFIENVTNSKFSIAKFNSRELKAYRSFASKFDDMN